MKKRYKGGRTNQPSLRLRKTEIRQTKFNSNKVTPENRGATIKP
jgi:hypothetical protein